MNWQQWWPVVSQWLLSSGLKIAAILLIALFINWLLKRYSNRFLLLLRPRKRREDGEFQKRMDTLSDVIGYVLNITVFVIVLAMVLAEVGVKIGPILAAAGVMGLAVGFGAQSLVKDIISGFFILLEDQIRVGDVVSVAGKGGLVEKVNLKMTILRDLSGNVHYIPNGNIEVVTNMTRGYSRFVFDIGVSYREDVDQVMDIMRQVDDELRADADFGPDIIEPLEIMGLDRFDDSAQIVRARTTTKPIKQWRIAREFQRRLKKRFDELDIEIPFPHVTLYMGQGKEGEAPPVNVKLEQSLD